MSYFTAQMALLLVLLPLNRIWCISYGDIDNNLLEIFEELFTCEKN